MDNLTHSFLGAALAQVALPPGPRPQRRLFHLAGVVAANLPDLDLVYTGVTPPPLGYLLHHRGHTHTLVGLLAQAVLFGILCLLFAPVRRLVPPDRRRLWMLIAAGLLSHVGLDAGNSYGVHPFFPFDARWYYGDAVFIFEPWLWLLLGVPVALAASRRAARLALLALIAILPAGLARAGVGRAPMMGDGEILDLRFDRGGDNFTAMRLRPPAEAAVCPPHLTSWEPPRADLLER